MRRICLSVLLLCARAICMETPPVDSAAARCYRNAPDALIACTNALAQNPRPEQKTNLLLAKAMVLSQAGEHNTAIAIYRQALSESPKSAAAHLLYAWGLDRAGTGRAADLEYTAAVRTGLLRGHEIVLNDAVRQMIRSIGREGNFYYAAAQSLDRLHENPAAKAFYLKAAYDFAQRPDPLVIEAYNHAVKMDPTDATVHAEIAKFWKNWDEKHGADVLAELKECVRLAPNDAQYHYDLGQAYAAAGDDANASTQYREAVRLNPLDKQAANELMIAAMTTGETGAMAAETPDTPEALKNLRKCVDYSGIRAEIACRSALEIGLSPHHAAEAHAFLANELPEPEAVTEYRAAIQADANYALAYYLLARRLGDKVAGTDDPAVLLQSAAKLRPDWVAPREAYARLLWSRSRHAEALAAQREALALEPEDEKLKAQLNAWQVEFATETEKVESAAGQVQIAPNNAGAHRTYGLALASAGRTDEAREEFRTAYKLDPRIGWRIASSVMYSGFSDVACEIYAELKPNEKLEYPQSSLEQDLGTCVRLYPNDTKYLAQLAQWQFSRGDGAAVRRTYESIIRIDSDYFETHPQARTIYDQAGVQRGAQ